MPSETRSFQIHPNLLFDVIKRQAGTLTKAIAEGVMNSIDAGARRVNVDITEASVTISDDGRGFKDRREVELFFETFGQPHQEGDAIYGTFRMGRGQMFSFGLNTWRTGVFAMTVDIKNKGLDYELSDEATPVAGCVVRIDLYTVLSLFQQREIKDDLRRMLRFVPTQILVDGQQINTDPEQERWDVVTDDAFIRFSTARLAIYNLGVFVNDSRAYHYGTGGVVVSRQQLRLNFARNEVLGDCPVWNRVTPALRQAAEREIKQKRHSLTIDERGLLARQLRSLDLTTSTNPLDAAVFQTCTGQWLSMGQLLSMGHDFKWAITAASKAADGVRAEKGHPVKEYAVVLNADTFDALFHTTALADVVRYVIAPYTSTSWNYKIVAFEKIAPDLDARRDLIEMRDYTPIEDVVATICNAFHYDAEGSRRIVIGDADPNVHGWTDGYRYIAINRSYLKGRDVGSPATWVDIAALLCHEYTHEGSSAATHVHSPEFYEEYHDKSVHFLPAFIALVSQRLPRELDRVSAKVTRQALRSADRAKTAQSKATALAALPAAEPLKSVKRAPRVIDVDLGRGFTPQTMF